MHSTDPSRNARTAFVGSAANWLPSGTVRWAMVRSRMRNFMVALFLAPDWLR